ncbi:MAG: S-methyl-5-thioribose-1-phosphate isomerase [Elusimicrobiota bacterium]
MKAVEFKDGVLYILDQRILPVEEKHIKIKSVSEAVSAIKSMAVRGAPAIGITAAYAYYIAFAKKSFSGKKDMLKTMAEEASAIKSARPTAVNLKWAVDRMHKKLNSLCAENVKKIKTALKNEADCILTQQRDADAKIGRNGAELLKNKRKEPLSVITHCNTGALATGGSGSAYGVIKEAYEKKLVKMVYASESRPLLQGARLTCYELQKDRIPYKLICDNTAAFVMKNRNIDLVIVGADRIAANGDTANKIGTYSLALLADFHGIPFYVAAPESSFDSETKRGEDIEIEYRESIEVLNINQKRIAPEGAKAENPAFDITPAGLISAYITERGIIKNGEKIQQNA